MAEQVLETDSDDKFWSFLNGNENKPKKIPNTGKVLINKEEKEKKDINEEEQEVSRDAAKKSEDKKGSISQRRSELQEALNRLDELEKLGVDESDRDDFDVDELVEEEYEEDKYTTRDDIVLRKIEDKGSQVTKEDQEVPTRPEPKVEPPCPDLNPDTWLVEIFGDKLPLMTQALGVVTAGVGLSALGLVAKVVWDAIRIIRYRM